MKEPLEKGLFDRVAGYQQAVLLLAGFAYAFGYASRALHAFEYNFGALPGVRFEYLVAGTLLLIPPVALCLAVWGIWRSAKRLAAWTAKTPRRKASVQNVLTGGLLLGMAMVLFRDPVQTIGIFFGAGCFLYLLIYLAAADKSPSTSDATTENANIGRWGKVLSWVGHGALYLWTAVVALWIGLLLLGVFALAVVLGAGALSYIPQEFGGVQPKCGVLDLSPEQLSPELRRLIASPTESLDPSSKVVRSRPLDVFTTSEPWLVRLRGTEASVPARSIRLNGKAVVSVEWCR